ncbi:MAG: protein jag [Anaerolineaceae bacterium]|nr:protein jag [Anaerolineaceae bacterium]
MSQEKTTLEVIAPTVEEAVQKGLAQLNLPQNAVEVEVLDAGSRGLFGLGSRQARIRLSIKPQPVQPVKASPVSSVPEPRVPVIETPVAKEEAEDIDISTGEEEEDQQASTTDEQDETLTAACEIVSELLEKMKVRARVSASYRPAEDDNDEQVVLVNVEGNDLSILIGRRSETLNALQYISSLIVCKRVDRWIPVMIDVQGYRARRERQLRQIARRMADQAIHTGRRQVLEPMPPNERRLIHLELREHPQVDTESVGDEPNRKVTIFIKK